MYLFMMINILMIKLKEMIWMETNILKMITVADMASLANAICGLFAILAVLNGNTILSAQLLLLAIVFDSIDGILARKFNNDSAHALFGENIDSLADVISFGVAPAIILYMITGSNLIIIPMILLIVCGVLRLTRYNTLLVDQTGPTKTFMGLPIPVSSMMLASLILSSFTDFNLMFVIMIIISILMVSGIEYPKVRDVKIMALLAVLTVLCIIPNVNGMLFSIPSCLLVILTFIYIFGTIIYNYTGYNISSSSVSIEGMDSMLENVGNITAGKLKHSSKSKKNLYKK